MSSRPLSLNKYSSLTPSIISYHPCYSVHNPLLHTRQLHIVGSLTIFQFLSSLHATSSSISTSMYLLLQDNHGVCVSLRCLILFQSGLSFCPAHLQSIVFVTITPSLLMTNLILTFYQDTRGRMTSIPRSSNYRTTKKYTYLCMNPLYPSSRSFPPLHIPPCSSMYSCTATCHLIPNVILIFGWQ